MEANDPEISVQKVLDILRYDPETGIFFWRYRSNNRQPRDLRAGCLSRDGYIQIKLCGRPVKAHRIAWLLMTGSWPSKQVDHINRDRSDNRFINLREASLRENQQNRNILRNNTSGVNGVCFCKKQKKWVARIRTEFGRINLGYFYDFTEAVNIRKLAEEKYFGKFSPL